MAMKRPAAASAEPPQKRPAAEAADPATLVTVRRGLSPGDVVFGGAFLGPWPGDKFEDHTQDDADAAIAAAYAAGVREFDTAPWYGYGSGEERMGRALVKLGPTAMEAVRINTKVGLLFSEPGGDPCYPGFEDPGRAPLGLRNITNNYSATGAERSMRESLKRMGIPRCWALRVHDPNDNINNRLSAVEDEVAACLAEGGALSGLRSLREKGEISHVGLGMNCNREPHQGVPDEIIRLLSEAPEGTFDSALLAGGWNLLCQDGLPCLVECQRRGIAVHVAGVFASGLLVGGPTYAYKPAPADKVERTAQWRELAESFGVDVQAVAVAFAYLPRCVEKVLIGMSTEAQVKEAMQAVLKSAAVPTALFVKAKELGLLCPELPLPPA